MQSPPPALPVRALDLESVYVWIVVAFNVSATAAAAFATQVATTLAPGAPTRSLAALRPPRPPAWSLARPLSDGTRWCGLSCCHSQSGVQHPNRQRVQAQLWLWLSVEPPISIFVEF